MIILEMAILCLYPPEIYEPFTPTFIFKKESFDEFFMALSVSGTISFYVYGFKRKFLIIYYIFLVIR